MTATIEAILSKGDRISYMECDWLDHRLNIWNAKIENISRVGIIGSFIEISTKESIRIVKLPYDDNDPYPLHINIDDVIDERLTPCTECYLSNSYYIKTTIVIAQSQIIAVTP
jgi:hypothetical protein